MTWLAAANMNVDKLLVFVIGKPKKRESFKNFNVVTEARTKAGWIQRFSKIGSQSLTINLKKKLGSCTVHPDIGRLKAINLFFLPPNTTSVLQPMGQMVICSLKARYRNKVVQKMIEAIDSKNSLPPISFLDAMKMLVLAWDEVTDKTVWNYLRKAGFSAVEDDDTLTDDPFATLNNSITQLSILDKIFEDITVKISDLLMICLCQQMSHYATRISWQTFYWWPTRIWQRGLYI